MRQWFTNHYYFLSVAGMLVLAVWTIWPLLSAHLTGEDFIWLYEASHETLLGLFQPGYFSFLRPVSNLFWWFVWQMGGTEPFPGHLLLLGCHLAAALLLGWWLKLITDSKIASVIGICLFLTSHLCLESVIWLSASGETLAGLFIMATIVSYWKYRITSLRYWQALAFVSLFLAIMSKESAVSIIPTLFLVEWLFQKKEASLKEHFSEPSFSVLNIPREIWQGVLSSISFLRQEKMDEECENRLERYAAIWPFCFFSLFLYLLLWLSLANRSFDLPYGSFSRSNGVLTTWLQYLLISAASPDVLQSSFTITIILAVLLVVLLLSLVVLFKHSPATVMSILWLPLTVLPFALFVANNVPHDRYFYISSLAWSALLATMAVSVKVNWKKWGIALAVLLIVFKQGQMYSSVADFLFMCIPNNEESSLAICGDKLNKADQVYISTQSDAEHFALYAYALYANADVAKLKTFAQLPNLSVFNFLGKEKSAPKRRLPGQKNGNTAAVPPTSLALHYSVWSGKFTDVSPQISDAVDSMVRDHRAPVAEPLPTQGVSLLVSSSVPPAGWTLNGVTINSDGSLHTIGKGGYLASPAFSVAPLAITNLEVNISVLSPLSAGASCMVNWGTKVNPLGQASITNDSPFLFRRSQSLLHSFSFGNTVEWWEQGDINCIYLFPCSEPCDFRIESVKMYGRPRLSQAE